MEKNLSRVRFLSRLLDSQFEFAGVKFGLDPIINIFPYVGDVAGALMSLYMLKVARELQVSRVDFIKMIMNIVIDFIVGFIPFLGVIFDVAFRANLKNLKILEKYAHGKFVEGQVVK